MKRAALALLLAVSAPLYAANLTAEVIHGKGIFIVANKDKFAWRDCDFDLNDDYSFKAAIIEAYGILSIPAGQFTKSNGDRFNPTRTKALKLYIYCRGTPHGTMSSLVGWR